MGMVIRLSGRKFCLKTIEVIFMRDSMKITVRYQFLYMLLMQTAASGVAIVFGWVAFWYFLNISIVKEILSMVFMTVNFAMLYIPAKKFAQFDNKPYTPLRPNKIKGVLFGCFVAALTMTLTLVFKLMWIYFSNEIGISGGVPTAVNALFYYWSFPFNGILGLNNGRFMSYAIPIMAALPIAATTAGYIAGCKNFEMAEKLDEFMYEKE